MLLIVYGRFLKLYLYTAISLISLSSFAGEGTSSVGKSFLKFLYSGLLGELIFNMLVLVRTIKTDRVVREMMGL